MNTQRATLSHVTERGRVSARETEVSLAPCVRHTSNMHVHVHVYVHVQLQVHVPRACACEIGVFKAVCTSVYRYTQHATRAWMRRFFHSVSLFSLCKQTRALLVRMAVLWGGGSASVLCHAAFSRVLCRVCCVAVDARTAL